MKALKLFRVFRLSKLITYMNATEDIKYSLKLFQLCFLLIIYMHVSGCIFLFCNDFIDKEKRWIPLEFQQTKKTYSDFEKLEWQQKWIHTFYASVLILMGNDIGPRAELHYYGSYFMIIIGAFFNANIFGTMAVIVQSFNRKSQKF
jgi:hypothetical protein